MPASADERAYSVLIPAYNAAATVGAAIASVLAQAPAPAEVIVVDDGSSDDTARLAAACGPAVRVVAQPNGGPGSATTRGLAEARFPVVAMIDSDDLWLPGKMQAQLDHLHADPACGGVFGHMRTFRNDDAHDPGGQVSPGWTRTTLVMRTADARRVGPVADFPGGRGDMIDWLARARGLGLRLDMLDEVVALRRIRPGSLSYGRDALQDKGYARVAWLALQRRRGKGP